jgi:hypothetical protein
MSSFFFQIKSLYKVVLLSQVKELSLYCCNKISKVYTKHLDHVKLRLIALALIVVVNIMSLGQNIIGVPPK